MLAAARPAQVALPAAHRSQESTARRLLLIGP